MRRILILITILFTYASTQNLYFPPLTGNDWESVTPASLGWNIGKIDSLYSYLSSTNSRAFLVLKDGKIVLEKYFGSFTRDSLWYWASAGKSLTAFLVGLAKQEGLLSLDDTTSKYLGTGWTSLTPSQEAQIKVIHQLTMTSGLDDGVPDPYCTLPSCLIYKASAGTRWAYHNGPYTLLDGVIQSATGMTLNLWYLQKLRTPTGMTGFFFPSGYNNVFYSTPRSMARYGLLMLNKGKWGNTSIMTDTTFFREMTNTSNQLNKSYGYLWWLNGKDSYMVPQTQFVFPGMIAPEAPRTMFSALGKNGQILNVVPELNLVTVRMGDAPGSSIEVPWIYNNDIWRLLSGVINWSPTTVEEESVPPQSFRLGIHPNPATGYVNLTAAGLGEETEVAVYSILGEKMPADLTGNVISISNWPAGVYQVMVKSGGRAITGKFVKITD